jgi:hypothetical protein
MAGDRPDLVIGAASRSRLAEIPKLEIGCKVCSGADSGEGVLEGASLVRAPVSSSMTI